jgi:aspartyl/asparaginyl beta-hydroxylase (cupin superfamily)
MMAVADGTRSAGGTFRKVRRKTVKKTGKFLIRGVSNFLYQQSPIGDRPVFDKGVFPWLAELEAGWRDMRAELDEILEDRDRLPAFHDLSPDQKRISLGRNWKTFGFYVFGDRYEPNCRRAPRTAALLESVPDLRNAWFSILAPGYHIPPHRGPTNGIVRIHLGLKIPRDRENCWMRVGNEIVHWSEGDSVVFDDFYEHEVQNNTDEERVVLFFDVDRPLRPVGRMLSRALIGTFKRTAYIKDAKSNLAEWDRR